MRLPSANDLIERAAAVLGDELEQPTGRLPFDVKDGLVVAAWMAALALRLITEAIAEARQQ